MLIDWVTFDLPKSHLTDDQECVFDQNHGKILKIAADGSIEWMRASWDSVRSDSHQVAILVGSDGVRVQGSPARVIGDGCTVFGSGAARSLDLVGCVDRMLAFVWCKWGVPGRPAPARFCRVSRVDVTQNYVLSGDSAVRQCLESLRSVATGRLRVRYTAGDTVYWNTSSRVRSGKAYAKGQHLRYLMNRSIGGKTYTHEELNLADRLLRLELSLKRDFFRRTDKYWWQLTALDLRNSHEEFFGKIVGGVKMSDDRILLNLRSLTESDKLARSVFSTWALVQQVGSEKAQSLLSRATWFRHKRLLLSVGVPEASLHGGSVIVDTETDVVRLRPVDCWSDLRVA